MQETSRKKTKGTKTQKTILIEKALDKLEASKEKQSDHIKTLSATWEDMFRNLEKHQQLYCSRKIMEALYQAALENLHEDSHKALEVRKEIFNCDPVRVDDSSPDVTN